MDFNITEAKQSLKNMGKQISLLIKETIELKSSLVSYRVTQHTISPELLHGSKTLDAVFKDGKFYIGNEVLIYDSYADKSLGDVMLKENDEMVFFRNRGYFHVAKKEDYENDQKQQALLLEKRKAKYELSYKYGELEWKIESFEFWEQYSIPFVYITDIKPVLSGLSANSNGDGTNRATVAHVILHEAFKDGRISRKQGEFLCSQPKGNHNYFFKDDIKNSTVQLQDAVTCKGCLAKLERYKITK